MVAVDEVVVGDLVMLEPGDQIIADGQLRATSDLRLDESVLTGEFQPAERRSPTKFAPARSSPRAPARTR